MSTNDTILIGPFRYTIIKRESHRILITWTESSGITKELWILFKGCTNIKEMEGRL